MNDSKIKFAVYIFFVFFLSGCTSTLPNGVKYQEVHYSPLTDEERTYIYDHHIKLVSYFINCFSVELLKVKGQYNSHDLNWREYWTFVGCKKTITLNFEIYEKNVDHKRPSIKNYPQRSFKWLGGNSCRVGEPRAGKKCYKGDVLYRKQVKLKNEPFKQRLIKIDN